MKLLRGKLQYRVNQKGYKLDPNQYLASSLSNSPIALQDFYQAYLNRPGPLRNLAYQLECAQKDLFLELKEDDDLEVILARKQGLMPEILRGRLDG